MPPTHEKRSQHASAIVRCGDEPREEDMMDGSQPYKHFRLVEAHVDVRPLLQEVEANEPAWAISTLRQEKLIEQRHTHTIFIRNVPEPRPKHLRTDDNHDNVWAEAATRFPLACDFFTKTADKLDGSLSRAYIVRLQPHSRVYPHVDGGLYYKYRDRFHFVVASATGSVLISGGETIRMKEGELWWFNNKETHESYNDSDQWRIHYIFDLLRPEHAHVARNDAVATDKRV
jgi:hypothetical protein